MTFVITPSDVLYAILALLIVLGYVIMLISKARIEKSNKKARGKIDNPGEGG